jgi:hypothetical protein
VLGQGLHHAELRLEVRLEEHGVRLRRDARDELVPSWSFRTVVPRRVEQDRLVGEAGGSRDLEVVDRDPDQPDLLGEPPSELFDGLVRVARHHPHGGARYPGWWMSGSVG